ncbi:thioredoxin family protein [Marinicauda algicola]|uniref:Thioredoxin family protein n=1 Tax=Marinicauda algicola TaxID=2029849 RepID=A0A4S2H4B3_9PROT|nr:thioredoxin family protein [Marinicauda algicola]TGY90248.1 thioredoxin family protein [Marinicauda algicola]
MCRLIALLAVVLTACTAPQSRAADGEGRVYDAAADASVQVDSALAEAHERNVNALIVFGANWCHDSRGLADRLTGEGRLAERAARDFAVRFVDIGERDRNLDQLARFGVEWVFGTPTVVIAAPDGALLNATSVHDWRMADSAAEADIAAYLSRYSTTPAPRGHAHADIDALVSLWEPLAARLAEIEAAEEPAEIAERRRAYATGYARSRARALMGEWESEHGAIADSAALEDRDPALDRTGEIAARFAGIERIAPERFSPTGAQ